MEKIKSNSFVGSIAIYIIVIKLFELLFSVGKLITVSNKLSDITFYIISIFNIAILIVVMRFLYRFFNRKKNILYFLIALALILILSSYFLNSYIGQIIGEADFEFSKLITYDKISGYSFFAFHIVFFTFRKFLFGNDGNGKE